MAVIQDCWFKFRVSVFSRSLTTCVIYTRDG